MIPAKAKTDPFHISKIREKDMESIIEWFERHQQSFYTLGWSYLRNQQQMEELFYRAITAAHEGLPRFKKDTPFETWASSIFIQSCRELSKEDQGQDAKRTEPRQDVFDALDHLGMHEREAIALTYLKGFTMEDSSRILQVDVETLEERIFSGIQSLRKEMGYGSHFAGCRDYKKNYIDYLGRTLGRPEKVELEIHIYHCPNCQEDLAAFQDVTLTLTGITEDFQAPPGFMEKVKHRVMENEKRRQLKKKKRNHIGLAFAGVLALLLCTGFVTGSFTSLYYTWTEDQEELRTYLQHDLGERLNLEAESEGVVIRIKGVVADDIQTLVFYEITDTKEDNQYAMNVHDGVFVQNEGEIMDRSANPRYGPPVTHSDRHDETNVYQGKMNLLPLTEDSGTVELKITRLQKLIRDSGDSDELSRLGSEEMEFAHGDWSFEIPVTKQSSVEHELAQETEIEGIPVRFDKLIIAPTATILQYSFKLGQPEKQIGMLNFDSIQAGDKKLDADLYGSNFVEASGNMDWNTLQTHFESLYGENVKELDVQFGSMHLTVQDPKTIELDPDQGYPQTFEYLGSTISIDKVEVGFPTKVVISNHDLKDRQYESLQFRVTGEKENENDTISMSMGMNSEGVLVDKNGKEYDIRKGPYRFEELDQPRYFHTIQTFEIFNDTSGEKVIPAKLEVEGYNTTKYLNEKVKIEL
ncbi:sigma-70 family RNA polymerase sigma factor [Bacillus sp. Marseille-Q1617]|uniref:sigma-70 family RNA polymerase sigma factor n=1 Tax=Bacillus sp. Marseille-Q1617 TaxID=2736887 RepID=UPI00158E324A|nr:sigma-70 family RNA polymerase sigma factor [Bacillus sp. Marseille-Q1617]